MLDNSVRSRKSWQSQLSTRLDLIIYQPAFNCLTLCTCNLTLFSSFLVTNPQLNPIKSPYADFPFFPPVITFCTRPKTKHRGKTTAKLLILHKKAPYLLILGQIICKRVSKLDLREIFADEWLAYPQSIFQCNKSLLISNEAHCKTVHQTTNILKLWRTITFLIMQLLYNRMGFPLKAHSLTLSVPPQFSLPFFVDCFGVPSSSLSLFFLTSRLPPYRVRSRIGLPAGWLAGWAKRAGFVGNREGITKRHERWERNDHSEGLLLSLFLSKLYTLDIELCDNIWLMYLNHNGL